MKTLLKLAILTLVFSFCALVAGCSPDVGSDKWCEDMKEKPKKDWTAGETADFAKHCVF